MHVQADAVPGVAHLVHLCSFKVDVPMEREYHEGDQLLPTEWVKDGIGCGTRRTDAGGMVDPPVAARPDWAAAVRFVEVGGLPRAT